MTGQSFSIRNISHQLDTTTGHTMTTAVVRKKRAGRKMKAGVVRETNGQAQRPSLAEREANVREVALIQRSKVGATPANAHHTEWASPVGILYKQDQLDGRQYEAAARFGNVANGYFATNGLMMPGPTPNAAYGKPNYSINTSLLTDEERSEMAFSLKEKYKEALSTLKHEGLSQRVNGLGDAVYTACALMLPLDVHKIGLLRMGLNALANLWKIPHLTKKKSSG